MSNVWYPKALEHFLSGDIDLTSTDIKCILVDTDDYTYDSSDEVLADVPAGARVATSSALSNVTVTNGVLDADDFTFSSVTGDESEALVYYSDGATKYLLVYDDTFSSGMPVTPNGGDVAVVINAAGIATL